MFYRCQTCCFSFKKIYSDWSSNLEEEPASTDPHHLKTWLQMVNQRCSLDHPVYHHLPSPSPWICVHVCTNCVSMCASVLSVYTKWFCGQFFFVSPVAKLQYLHFQGGPVMLHMNLHWRNVFGFLGLELDQPLRVTCAQSGCF